MADDYVQQYGRAHRPGFLHPMDSAPQDGRRILIRYVCMSYIYGQWREDGDKWEECYWDPTYMNHDADFRPFFGGWRVWTGSGRTQQLGSIGRPLGWTPRPADETSADVYRQPVIDATTPQHIKDDLPYTDIDPLPCPFCGSLDLMAHHLWIACKTCGASGPGPKRLGTVPGPKEAWNTRFK